MKLKFALIIGLAGHTVLASPVVQRDDSTVLTTLISTIKTHTANINATLAKLPTVTTTASTSAATASLASGTSNTTSSITAEFSAIAKAMTSATFSTVTSKRGNLPAGAGAGGVFPRQDTTACNATCLSASYISMGALTAEIAYTVKGCVGKNAVDITSPSSVLVPVIQGLATVTKELALVVGPVAGVVVQNLEAALGAEIGGALVALVSAA